ncbi:cell wall metabolism sensor histidine kinase WalK [Microbacterium sp. SORGH_AS_0888]|uniref:sensor histidine kinase n=1 Tax=Microbacterium sp. SORGH_AS_0888 TaxID=3041791 RepID=UPI00278AFD6B|nr:ATP-binding protein [Microbacterium sp. SORGH_AS_0888]MDQ1131072.1 two-component system sensor histidine kinase SenX3 [Microbacterium sp. SORGH_AS_0888]
MDSTQLALVALLVGIVIGSGAALLIVISLRARARVVAQSSVDMPEGVTDVLRAMDDAALVVDASSTIRGASAAASGFGLLVGETLPDDRLRELARAVRVGGGAGSALLSLRRAAAPADQRQVSARATVITPRLVLVVLRDITERERVEQMRRDFVANTSHELKTPVGAITLLAEAVESAADDPQQVRAFAARLSAEAARLASLTSRVMNLSRLQSADESADMREVPVDEVVTSAIEAHALAANAAGVTLVRGGTRGLFVRGDAHILGEALGNLIANAIAYSPAGSSVGVGVKPVHNAVEIAVTDRGIGISEEEQQRVFERFYRSDQARSRRTGGTGLGLSIVKHAVQRHGGEVRVWSRPGRGSTFTIQLPMTGAPEPLEPRGARAKPARPRKKKSKNAVPSEAAENGAPA